MNHHHIVDALQVASVDVRDDVLEALDDVLASPFEPTAVEVHVFQAGAGGRERWVAWLPHGYVITYRPFLNGPPPLAGKHVAVHSFDRIDDLFAEWGLDQLGPGDS